MCRSETGDAIIGYSLERHDGRIDRAAKHIPCGLVPTILTLVDDP